ncbi:MAG: cation transporter [Gemmatimonadota bacterium]
MATTKKLKVDGMTCDHCVAAVKNALEGLQGVHAARVDLQGKRAEVEYDEDRLDTAEMITAVEDEGYTAQELP